VEPGSGDRVLVAWSSEETWVLAVLERAASGPVRLTTRADTELAVEGTLSLRATRTIAVHAPSVSVGTGTWFLRAADAVLSTERLSLSSVRALLEVRGVQAVLGAVETVAEHVMQRLGRSSRFVEGVDHVRAGCVDVSAESIMSLHAHDTLMTADGLFKADADQIHLG
jgi:hypothetical protein